MKNRKPRVHPGVPREKSRESLKNMILINGIEEVLKPNTKMKTVLNRQKIHTQVINNLCNIK